MINKRLLIKNLIARNDENSFYDKKRQINIGDKESKVKFLKHICALSNSNPQNNSYIIIRYWRPTNRTVGVDFFDDSKNQNLINTFLENPPIIQYEDIAFLQPSEYKPRPTKQKNLFLKKSVSILQVKLDALGKW